MAHGNVCITQKSKTQSQVAALTYLFHCALEYIPIRFLKYVEY